MYVVAASHKGIYLSKYIVIVSAHEIGGSMQIMMKVCMYV